MGNKAEERRIQRDSKRLHRKAIREFETMNTMDYYTKIVASKDKVDELSSKKFDLQQELENMEEVPTVGEINPQELQQHSQMCEAIGTIAGMAGVGFMGIPGFDAEVMLSLGAMGMSAISPAIMLADQKHNIFDRAVDGVTRYILKKQIAKTDRDLKRAEIYNYELRDALSIEHDIDDPRHVDCVEFERDWEKGL